MQQITRIPHLLSVVNYAKAAGVKSRTLHERFRKGAMQPVVLDGQKFIDVRACPPGQFRKLYPAPPPMPIGLPQGTEAENLRTVKNYSKIFNEFAQK